MLEGNVATRLLTQERADEGCCMLAERMSRYVVGDCEEYEGVEGDVERRVGRFDG